MERRNKNEPGEVSTDRSISFKSEINNDEIQSLGGPTAGHFFSQDTLRKTHVYFQNTQSDCLHAKSELEEQVLPNILTIDWVEL